MGRKVHLDRDQCLPPIQYVPLVYVVRILDFQSGETSSILVRDTNKWLYGIKAITSACLAENRGSIPRRVANTAVLAYVVKRWIEAPKNLMRTQGAAPLT